MKYTGQAWAGFHLFTFFIPKVQKLSCCYVYIVHNFTCYAGTITLNISTPEKLNIAKRNETVMLRICIKDLKIIHLLSSVTKIAEVILPITKDRG